MYDFTYPDQCCSGFCVSDDNGFHVTVDVVGVASHLADYLNGLSNEIQTLRAENLRMKTDLRIVEDCVTHTLDCLRRDSDTGVKELLDLAREHYDISDLYRQRARAGCAHTNTEVDGGHCYCTLCNKHLGDPCECGHLKASFIQTCESCGKW